MPYFPGAKMLWGSNTPLMRQANSLNSGALEKNAVHIGCTRPVLLIALDLGGLRNFVLEREHSGGFVGVGFVIEERGQDNNGSRGRHHECEINV